MIKRSLDLDAIRAFVHIADLKSFTRAAEMTHTTQAAVSLKLKRLEEHLGCRLLDRTPRQVRLSSHGAVFLEHARDLLRLHDKTYSILGNARERLVIGISDHVAGPELPTVIARMNKNDPQLVIEISIGSSSELLERYDRHELDAAIVRFDAGRDDGKTLTTEKFGWFAAESWQYSAEAPLPLATMPDPCQVRQLAEKYLDDAGIPWTEVFVGGGVAAVSAAVMANIGVAAMARRMLPLGAVEVGQRLGLPELPALPIILHTRISRGRPHEALETLSNVFRSAV